LNRRIVTKASKIFLGHDEGEGAREPDSGTFNGSVARVCKAEDSWVARDSWYPKRGVGSFQRKYCLSFGKSDARQ
jgi:hypothetical protein